MLRNIGILVFLLAPCLIVSAENLYLFKAGYGIKLIHIGASCTKDLTDRLGPPISANYNESTDTVGLLYPDYLLIINRDLQVSAIILMYPNYKDKDGIGVGSTEEAAVSKYGQDYKLHTFEDKTMLIYASKGITFIIKDGKVMAIILFPGLTIPTVTT